MRDNMGNHSHGSPEDSGTVAKADDVLRIGSRIRVYHRTVRASQTATRAKPSDTSAK